MSTVLKATIGNGPGITIERVVTLDGSQRTDNREFVFAEPPPGHGWVKVGVSRDQERATLWRRIRIGRFA